MNINSVPVMIFLFVAAACSKKQGDQTPAPPPTLNIRLTIDSSQALPGNTVIIQLNKRISNAETSILFGSSSVKGYAKGDSAYLVIVPVLAPGAVSVSIPSIPNANTLSVTIRNYTPISNSQTVVTEFLQKRDQCIDSITKVVSGSNFQPSSESLTLIQQLKEEWNEQYALLSAAEKEIVAYVLQRNMPDPSKMSFSALPAGAYGGRLTGIQDLGDELVEQAKAFVFAVVGADAAAWGVLISGAAFLIAPNHYTLILFVGVLITYYLLRENAIRKGEQVGRLNGIGEALTESFVNRIMSSEFKNNDEKTVEFKVRFRNLKPEDKGLQADISKAFTEETTLYNSDQKVANTYTQVIAKTNRLKISYLTYQQILGKKPASSLLVPVKGNNVLIKGVSNTNINFTSTVSGTDRKVKIRSASNSAIDFQLQVAYKRTIDNKEITAEIPCTYKPYAVGEVHAGGIIFYLFKSGDAAYTGDEQHGLIVATVDQSGPRNWGCYGTDLPGAASSSIGSGKQNTQDIRNACAGSAANVAAGYRGGNFSDWYLPSLGELQLIYQMRNSIGNFSNTTTGIYWSSTEGNASCAQGINFLQNETACWIKDFGYGAVRAVRNF